MGEQVENLYRYQLHWLRMNHLNFSLFFSILLLFIFSIYLIQPAINLQYLL